jgi:hypothetical protein
VIEQRIELRLRAFLGQSDRVKAQNHPAPPVEL